MTYASRTRTLTVLVVGFATNAVLGCAGCHHPEQRQHSVARKSALTTPSHARAAHLLPLDSRQLHPEAVYSVVLSQDQWAERLTPQQFAILRKHATERAWSSSLLNNKREGTYACAGCGQALFSSDAKYDSGTGWPSFQASLRANSVATSNDTVLLSPRVEVHCSRCGGHLGHVFQDGPPPTGLRYCINGAALNFLPISENEDGATAVSGEASEH